MAMLTKCSKYVCSGIALLCLLPLIPLAAAAKWARSV
jgi:hypothetical protein